MRHILILALAMMLAGCGKDTSHLQGWVEGDFVFVGPDEAGRVQTLSVREGDAVGINAPLFTVDADLQQADVHTAAAQVAETASRSTADSSPGERLPRTIVPEPNAS